MPNGKIKMNLEFKIGSVTYILGRHVRKIALDESSIMISLQDGSILIATPPKGAQLVISKSPPDKKKFTLK